METRSRRRCRVDPAKLTDSQRGDLLAYYLATVDAEYKSRLAALKDLRQKRSALVDPVAEIMVMKEMPRPRPTYLLKRGAYDAPADRVEPGTPASLPPFDSSWPRNRLGLAQWLTDPKHPLTARVAVNRWWQAFFGRGIVATPEDFGSQGQLPSHPELLDWLARTFIDSGWDVKRLVRLIVTSATYRQSSDAPAELLAKDPENMLLARGPRFRLPAEMIRDGALAASGLLVDTIGGPPVKPYQPPGLWEEKSGLTYQRDVGAGQPPPQPLYVLEADLAAAGHADFRRHHPRGLRRQAADDRHSAPGARAPERSPVRRGRAGTGPASHERRRARPSPTGSRSSSAR